MLIGEYETHPTADVFPLMEGPDFDALCEDIRAYGLREPITRARLKGKRVVLDGRNRLRACQVARVKPDWRDYDGEPGGVVAFVLSANLHRRHLDESQRAMVAARIANMGEGRPSKTASIEAVSQERAAELLNVDRSSVQRARRVLEHGSQEVVAAVDRGVLSVSAASQLVDRAAPEQRRVATAVLSGEDARNAMRELHRDERVARLAEIVKGNAALDGGVGRHPVIYADPPWRYEHAESRTREIENQYPTMELDAICALPVQDVTTDDAVLFLWATSPKLAEALRVVEAWGFVYRTCMVWDKERIGMGYYARQQHELLLIATRGQPPAPAPEARPPSVIRAPRGEHSAKPERFYEIIEAMYGPLPKLELFCRSPRAGWKVWGNQSAA